MIDRERIRNPFDQDEVADPNAPAQTDVPRIHSSAFKLCIGCYERVAAQGCSWSLLLHGEAGCGKTHLLGRFQRWLAGEFDSKPSVSPALFVPVRMETGPGQIWRHVRRRFAEGLTRRVEDGSTPLDALLHNFAAQYSGEITVAFEDASLQDTSLDLMKVLEQYAKGKQRRQCRAWLTGDGLSDADLQALNLPAASLGAIDEEYAESEAHRIVLAITRLCQPAPVVFVSIKSKRLIYRKSPRA